MSQVEIEEAMEIVKHIEDVRVKNALEDAQLIPLVVEAQYCLGLLFFQMQDYALAKTSFQECCTKTDLKQVSVVRIIEKANILLEKYGEIFASVDDGMMVGGDPQAAVTQ